MLRGSFFSALFLSVVFGARAVQGAEFIRGNANDDSRIDIGDAIWILQYQFQDGPPPPCLKSADANDDGRIDIGDAIYLLQWQFGNGASPPPPTEACGPDPTPDPLPCDRSSCGPVAAAVARIVLAAPSPVRAGQKVTIEARTLAEGGGPAYDSFFDVFFEIHTDRSDTMSQLPGDTHARILPMENLRNGTYRSDLTIAVAGMYGLQAIVVDRRTMDKVPRLVGTAPLEVIPIEIVSLELVGTSPFPPIIVAGRDRFGNLASLSPGDLTAASDSAAIRPGVPRTQLQTAGRQLVAIDVQFTAYAVGNVIVKHNPSGATARKEVGYAPWRLHFDPREQPGTQPPPLGAEGAGFRVQSFFDVFFDINVPNNSPRGWTSFQFQLVWPANAPIAFAGATPALQGLQVMAQGPFDVPGGMKALQISGRILDDSEKKGDLKAFALAFQTGGQGHADPIPFTLQFPPPGPTLADNRGTPIAYDPTLYFSLTGPKAPFSQWLCTIKPVKRLRMHIYRVEGSATDAEINADVKAAEDMFNLNAFLCTLGFYVDFTAEITTIPKKDWGDIDQDGDGLDRFDRNGDGDYADPGDNNDLFNAMDKGYFDSGAATENIYYVPGIRGGALGTTYWPNKQVAVDNSQDSDNLTLAHEKVHEMDLRMDGDFDVGDGADMDKTKKGVQKDPTADGQGAYGAKNIMNYGDTGPFLTEEQAKHLDP